MSPARFRIVSALAIVLPACSNSTQNDVREHDAGAFLVTHKEKIHHSFIVRNDTNRILNIKELTRSCNCADAKLESMSVRPGESTDLHMDLALQPGVGNRKVQATLETDDPAEPLRTYSILYRTYSPLRFNEGSIDLGTIDSEAAQRGEVVERTAWIEIYEKVGSPPDHLDKVIAPSPIRVEVVKNPETTLFERKSIRRSRYLIKVSRDPASLLQEASGIHSAIVSGSTVSGATATVAVTWSLAHPLTVSPSKVSFGLLKPSTRSDSRKVVAASQDGVPFRILEIVGGDGIEIVVDSGVGPSATPNLDHQIEIRYNPAGTGSRFRTGRVSIATDHPRMTRFDLPWSAILRD